MTLPLSHQMGNLDSELDRALQYHNTGQFQAAKQIYHTILGRDANHADALHLLGVLTHQTGDHHQAVRQIEKAILLNPSNPFYYCNLGVVYRSLELFDRSISCYRRALELKPDYTDAFNNLANIFRKQGRLKQAAALHQKALSLQPDDAATYNNLGHVYRELGSVRDEIACYEKALLVDPDYAQFTRAIPFPGSSMYTTLKNQGKIITDNWDDYDYLTTDTKIFIHDNLSHETIQKKMKAAYRRFYLRPSFIYRETKKRLSREGLRKLVITIPFALKRFLR